MPVTSRDTPNYQRKCSALRGPSKLAASRQWARQALGVVPERSALDRPGVARRAGSQGATCTTSRTRHFPEGKGATLRRRGHLTPSTTRTRALAFGELTPGHCQERLAPVARPRSAARTRAQGRCGARRRHQDTTKAYSLSGRDETNRRTGERCVEAVRTSAGQHAHTHRKPLALPESRGGGAARAISQRAEQLPTAANTDKSLIPACRRSIRAMPARHLRRIPLRGRAPRGACPAGPRPRPGQGRVRRFLALAMRAPSCGAWQARLCCPPRDAQSTGRTQRSIR